MVFYGWHEKMHDHVERLDHQMCGFIEFLKNQAHPPSRPMQQKGLMRTMHEQLTPRWAARPPRTYKYFHQGHLQCISPFGVSSNHTLSKCYRCRQMAHPGGGGGGGELPIKVPGRACKHKPANCPPNRHIGDSFGFIQ